MKKYIFLALVAFTTVFHTAAMAVEQPGTPLRLNHALTLSQFEGRSFLEAMTATGGIKENLDADLQDSFAVADKATLHQASKNFAPKVYNKIVRLFKNGESGLDSLLDAIAGKHATPASISGVIGNELERQNLLSDTSKIGLASVTIAPLLSLVSGGGTSVQLDANNITYSIGYKKGGAESADIEKDVKSGRSFGSSWNHKSLDPSDVDYLKELQAYLSHSTDTALFYKTLFEMITECSARNLHALSQEGQTVATDFMAIYTAELDRYIMTGFKKHPWQNDLAETTLLAAYSARAGMIQLNGEFRNGDLQEFFGVSQTSTGSGIGITRSDRTALQAKISKAERNLHPALIESIERVIGAAPKGDLFHGLMIFLNEPKNQGKIRANAKVLTDAVADLLSVIGPDSEAITSSILLR